MFIAIFGFCSCFASIAAVVVSVSSDVSDENCCAIASLSGIVFASGVMLTLYGFGVVR